MPESSRVALSRMRDNPSHENALPDGRRHPAPLSRRCAPRSPRYPPLMRAIATAVLIGVLSFLLAACSVVDWRDGGANAALDGPWTLESLDSGEGPVPVLADHPAPEMTLDAGDVTGTSGVNSFSGDYTWNRDGSFSFGALAWTEIAGDPEAMAQEAAFFDALQAVERFEVADTKLLLSNVEGRELLVFVPGRS